MDFYSITTNRPPARRAVALTLLIACGAGTLVTTTAVQAQSGLPNVVVINATVRDFLSSHPDFDLPMGSASNQAAGFVELIPELDGDPLLKSGGFIVDDNWREQESNEIAPHMYVASMSGGIDLVNSPDSKNNPTLDTYNPNLGAYGGSNIGPMPNVLTGVTMPAIPPTPDFGPSLGNVEFAGNSSSTITMSFSCDWFRIRNNHTVTIQGDVTIVVSGNWEVENHSVLEIEPGGSLTVFIGGWGRIRNNTSVNMNTADHTAFTVYMMGNNPFEVENSAEVYLNLTAPNADLRMRNNSDVYGTVIGLGLRIENPAGLHIAGLGTGGNCGVLNDVMGAWGGASNGMITSEFSFSQWFNTIPGVNASARVPLTFLRNADGILEFIRSEFTPIDNRLFGNEGEEHNRNFTLELDAQFTNESCQGHFFEFTGDGEVWVYINNQLVIDLAGPQTNGHQYIDIDRLGLVNGQTYKLRLYYAQRVAREDEIVIRTNLNIGDAISFGIPVSAVFD